jgi:hypothetical protein
VQARLPSSDEVIPTKQAKHYALRIGLDGTKHIWLRVKLSYDQHVMQHCLKQTIIHGFVSTCSLENSNVVYQAGRQPLLPERDCPHSPAVSPLTTPPLIIIDQLPTTTTNTTSNSQALSKTTHTPSLNA